MSEYFKKHSVESLPVGEYEIEIIENPQRSLTEDQIVEVAIEANSVLAVTTGIEDRSIDEVKRYLFGTVDRGRVLNLFRKDEKLVGFSSWHLLNTEGEFIRFDDSTVLHAGSVHILPEEQGGKLWLTAAKIYLGKLPKSLQPKYVEGFTQSPRLFKLLHSVCRGRVYPNVKGDADVEALKKVQEEILPKILLGMGSLNIENQSVVKGLGEHVYARVPSTGDFYEDVFFNRLQVNVADGDFLHFVAEIPKEIYE